MRYARVMSHYKWITFLIENFMVILYFMKGQLHGTIKIKLSASGIYNLT